MNLKSHEVAVFTDGASRGNPGPGGFGAIIIAPKIHDSRLRRPMLRRRLQQDKGFGGQAGFTVQELGGREEHTTNNRMELRAAIEALLRIKDKGLRIIVYSDSSYVINGITKWVQNWQKNGWKTVGKKEIENRDLWEQLLNSTMHRNIEWRIVGGHVGVAGNERCDEIATAFADGVRPTLYSGPISGYQIKDILNLYDISYKKRERRDMSRAHQKARAYSYVSAVDGVVQIHKTWAECEARVKGARGARYRKVFSAREEEELKREWQGPDGLGSYGR